jgi:hypothetical protein
MTNHILIQRAVRRPHVAAPSLPAGAVYDAVSGCWQADENGQAFELATTKKQDIETGEDMKGQ